MKKGFGFICGILFLLLIAYPFLSTPHSATFKADILYTSEEGAILTPYRAFPFYLETPTSRFDKEAVVIDLNHDGIQDLVFEQWNPNYFIAMNASGEVYWRVAYTDPYMYGGDFDRDGFIDDIVSYSSTGLNLKAWNESGDFIYFAINDTINYSPQVLNGYIGDFNSDGYLDDVSFQFDNVTGFYFATMNYFTRKYLWNFSLGQHWLSNIHTPCDLTNNGFIDNYFLSTLGNHSYAINNNGSLLWSFPGGGYRAGTYQPITLTDMDHDGFLDDIVFVSPCNNSIFALNNTGGLLWNYSSATARTVRACDYDKDSYIDETCILEYGKLVVLNETGDVILEVATNLGLQKVLITDITGDGWVDFLISGIKLLILNHSGDVLWAKGYYVTHHPITLADFNGDGAANDSLWSIGDDMVAFRWGLPNLTFTFLDSDPLELPIKSWQTIRLNLISHEPYYAQTINVTINGQPAEVTVDPNGSQLYNAYIYLSETGDYLYQVGFEYLGVEFFTDAITVTGVPAIPFLGWWMGIVFIVLYRISKRRKNI